MAPVYGQGLLAALYPLPQEPSWLVPVYASARDGEPHLALHEA